nr:protein stabilized1 [Tanacetum cinerariifolium]
MQRVEFEVEPQEDHTFEVEPHGNVDLVAGSQEVQIQDLIYYHLARDREQHSKHKLFNYIEDNNEAAFAVAKAEKIYAHESLTFNNTVAIEVIFKWKAGLKDDMDAPSDVYVLSNGCKKCNDDSNGLLDKAKGNVLGMKIVRDQSGNTLRVLQTRFYNKKLVHTLLEGHSILSLSLKGSLSGDYDVKNNDCKQKQGCVERGVHFKKWCPMQSKIKSGAIAEMDSRRKDKHEARLKDEIVRPVPDTLLEKARREKEYEFRTQDLTAVGYLTNLQTLKISNDAEISNIKKVVKNEDLWIEACRLVNPHEAKAVISRGVKGIPNSVKLWMQAATLEHDDVIKSKVLRKGLENIPYSVRISPPNTHDIHKMNIGLPHHKNIILWIDVIK